MVKIPQYQIERVPGMTIGSRFALRLVDRDTGEPYERDGEVVTFKRPDEAIAFLRDEIGEAWVVRPDDRTIELVSPHRPHIWTDRQTVSRHRRRMDVVTCSVCGAEAEVPPGETPAPGICNGEG